MVAGQQTTATAIRALALAVVLAVAFVAGPPLVRVWRCYAAASNGEHLRAELINKHAGLGLVLMFHTQDGELGSCLAEAPAATFERAEPGDAFDVVLKPDKPGECYLESGLRASSAVLWAATGVTLAVMALIWRLAGELVRLLVNRRAASGPHAAGGDAGAS